MDSRTRKYNVACKALSREMVRVESLDVKLQVYVSFRTVHGLYALVLRYARHPFRQFYNRIQAHKFGVKGIRFGPGARLQGISAIQMGEGFSAGPGLWLEAVLRYEDQTFTPRIVIGRNVEISTWGHIAATHYVEIGDDVLIGSRVIITDHNHVSIAGLTALRRFRRVFALWTVTRRS